MNLKQRIRYPARNDARTWHDREKQLRFMAHRMTKRDHTRSKRFHPFRLQCSPEGHRRWRVCRSPNWRR